MLARFCLFAAFAGPLIELNAEFLNPGIELVGGPGDGKSMIGKLMSSVWGPPGLDGPDFGRSWQSTINGLESMATEHRDNLLCLDEAGHFRSGESLSQRGEAFRAAVFQLADGQAKERHGQSAPSERRRFLWFSSANTPLSERLSSVPTGQAAAACSRVLTLRSGASADLGVFNAVDSRDVTKNELIQELVTVISTNYGVAGRRFIERLAAARAKDEGALRTLVRGYVETFASPGAISTPLDRNNRTLGLVYAAGQLAITYGVLPSNWKARLVCRRVQRRQVSNPEPDVLQRLRRHARKYKPARIKGKASLQALTDPAIATLPGFIKTVKGVDELLLTRSQLTRHFGEGDAVITAAREAGCLVTDKVGRDLTVKRVIRRKTASSDGDRVYAFDLRKLVQITTKIG